MAPGLLPDAGLGPALVHEQVLDEVDAGDREQGVGGPGALVRADYVPQGTTIAMVHTEVDPAHENQGLATKVVDAALADVRARGLRVLPACSFVRLHLRRQREEYADIL